MSVFWVWDFEYFETIDSNEGEKIFLSEVVSVFCFLSNGVNVEEARLCRQPPVVHYCRFILLCVQNGGREGTFFSFFLSLLHFSFVELFLGDWIIIIIIGVTDVLENLIVEMHNGLLFLIRGAFFACGHYCAWQTKLGVMKSFQWRFECVCACARAVFAHAKRDNFIWTSLFRSFTVLGCHKANQILGPKSTLKSMILGVNLKSW
jgi:hypothetical protein